MKRTSLLIIISVLIVYGCVTSLTPSQFLEKFPRSTSSGFYGRSDANEVIANGKCELLVADRKYVSPIGFTVDGDMHYGAAGVDEWVRADKGNSYALNNFEWISVGDQGATQLIIYFDTMLCK